MAKNQSALIEVNYQLMEQFFKENFPNHYIYEQDFLMSTYRRSSIEVYFYDYTKEELKILLTYIEKQPENTQGLYKQLQRLRKYINILDSYETKVPKQLNDLSTTIREYIKNRSYRYLLKTYGCGDIEYMYRVTNVKYTEYNQQYQTPAHVDIILSYVSRNKKESRSITFYYEDVIGNKLTLENLFMKKGYVLATEEDFQEYLKSYDRYKQIVGECGIQYTVQTQVETEQPREYFGRDKRYIIDENTPAKCVIDEDVNAQVKSEYDNMTFFIGKDKLDEGEFERYQSVDHCVVKLFSLDLHVNVYCHSDFLTKYEYNKDVYKNLILPPDHKECLNTILEFDPLEFTDIVSNKSGGVVVLASGPAGVGKTLSAETYSELIQKPLYSVQSAQLGISITNIEENLKQVLSRASKWKAVLLIDEADVFIRARDNDLNQNAIVGIFLRVLEHFDGILFMTTNRFLGQDGNQFVDDAILSRCIAHLRYKLPNEEAIKKIFEVQLKTLGVKCSESNLLEIIEHLNQYNISGRDIKNIVKLSKMFLKRDKKSMLTLDIVKKIIPFHSTISKKIDN